MIRLDTSQRACGLPDVFLVTGSRLPHRNRRQHHRAVWRSAAQPDGSRQVSRRWHTRRRREPDRSRVPNDGVRRRSSKSKARARWWSATRRSRSSSQLARPSFRSSRGGRQSAALQFDRRAPGSAGNLNAINLSAVTMRGTSGRLPTRRTSRAFTECRRGTFEKKRTSSPAPPILGSRSGRRCRLDPTRRDRAVGQAFEQAVARCQAPGKVGIFLSGGLDSVSIAAVAASRAHAAGEPDPLALSLAFPHPDANEEPVHRRHCQGRGRPRTGAVPLGRCRGPAGAVPRVDRPERSRTLSTAEPVDACVRAARDRRP